MIATLLSLAAVALGVVPPAAADSTVYRVVNHGRPAGDMVVTTRGDSVVVRYIFVDRNRGTRVETRYRMGPGGTVLAAEARPIAADGRAGDATDHFEISGDSVRWSLANGRDGTPPQAAHPEPGTFVQVRSGTPFEQARLARFLLARPQKSARMLPGSTPVSAEVIGETTVRTQNGREHVRLVMVRFGNNATPSGVWLDDKGGFFATDVQWFITVRPDAEGALPALRDIEIRYRNAQAEATGRKLGGPANGTVVIRNGDVFDSESGVVHPRTSIVIRGDRIVEVGPAGAVATPDGARVIDATGKTVMPGLWEMHTHLQLTNQNAGSLLQLTQGLTTVRDLAADIDVAVSQRDREQAGLLASPRVILAGFMEGPGRWAGPSEVIVKTEAEARAWIARYDSLGYRQIKLYNIIQQDLLPVIAAETHRRGMRLSGHVPRGLSVPAAVLLGYDEIQHAAFLFSTFFQDSLYVPTMRAYSAVATAVAPHIDVDGQPMTDLIAFLKQHNTVIDGTFNIWIGGGAALVGAGGSTDQQQADAAYLRLIRRLYDAGITLVAGTDNSAGTTYRRELELYEQAGIPAPRVLQLATIGSARVMKDEQDYGSIVPGKVADVLIVGGNPAEHVTELSKLEIVIRGGRVYAVKDLLAQLSR
jgi:hypothetical protein